MRLKPPIKEAIHISLLVFSFPTLVLVLFFLILLWLKSSEGNKKSPPAPQYSQSIDDSKKNGVFQFEVVADKPSVVLDSGLKFEIKEAWVENEWYMQNYVFGKPTMSKENADELIMKLNIASDQQEPKQYYYFIGNKLLDTFIRYYCHRIDTIKAPMYKEITDELPSKTNRKAFETITFVKRIVIR